MAKCKRCERKLTDPISKDRGYGPVCWEKEGQFKQPRIQELEAKIDRLEKQIAALQISPSVSLPPVPNGEMKERSEIPLMVGCWDVSELKENALFQKMQAICEVA